MKTAHQLLILMVMALSACLIAQVQVSNAAKDVPGPHFLKTNQSGIAKTPKISIDRGYCCVNGETSLMQSKQCAAKKGTFYTDKKEAQQNCGYCCVSGQVTALSPKQCKIKRGKFYQTQKLAEQNCTGYCCRDGKISAATKVQCANKGDKFFTRKAVAEKSCTGWCCDDFEVSQTTEQGCKQDQGKYFGNKPQADRYCDSLKGWCCVGGEIKEITPAACSRERGKFYPSSAQAKQNCKEPRGYCNVDGKTLRVNKKVCERKKGRWFSNQMLAIRNLKQQDSPKERPVPGIKTDDDRFAAPSASSHDDKNQAAAALGVKPDVDSPRSSLEEVGNPNEMVGRLGQPNLVASRAFVRNNRIWVSFTNNGRRHYLSPEFDSNKRVRFAGYRSGAPSNQNQPGSSGPTHTNTPRPNWKRVYQLQSVVPADIMRSEPGWVHEFDTGIPYSYTCEDYPEHCEQQGIMQVIRPTDLRITLDRGCINPRFRHQRSEFRLGISSQAPTSPPPATVQNLMGGEPDQSDDSKKAAQKAGQGGKATEPRIPAKKLDLQRLGTEKLPVDSRMSNRDFFKLSFRFIHPTENEEFRNTTPEFSWIPHAAANKYFLRIMKNVGSPGSYQTIWSRSGISTTSIRYNDDGNAVENLEPGSEYRANLYARRSDQTGTPTGDPNDFVEMTGDVVFTVDRDLKTNDRVLTKLDKDNLAVPFTINKNGKKPPNIKPIKTPGKGLVPAPGTMNGNDMTFRDDESGYTLSLYPVQETYQMDETITVTYIVDSGLMPDPPENLRLVLKPEGYHRFFADSAAVSTSISTSGSPNGNWSFTPERISAHILSNCYFQLLDADTNEPLATSETFNLENPDYHPVSNYVEVLEPREGQVYPIDGPHDLNIRLSQEHAALYPGPVTIYITGPGSLLHLVYHGSFPTESVPVDVDAFAPEEGEYYRVLVLYDDGEDTIGRSGLFSFSNLQVLAITPEVLGMMQANFYRNIFNIEVSGTEFTVGDTVTVTMSRNPSFEDVAAVHGDLYACREAEPCSLALFARHEPFLLSEPGTLYFKYYAQLDTNNPRIEMGRSEIIHITGEAMVTEIIEPREGARIPAGDSFNIRFNINEAAKRNLESIRVTLNPNDSSGRHTFTLPYTGSNVFEIPIDFYGEHRNLLNAELELVAFFLFSSGFDNIYGKVDNILFNPVFAMDPEFLLNLTAHNTPSIENIVCKPAGGSSSSWDSTCRIPVSDRVTYTARITGTALGEQQGRIKLSWSAGGTRRWVWIDPAKISWSNEMVTFILPDNIDADENNEAVKLTLQTADGELLYQNNAITYTYEMVEKFICAGGFEHYHDNTWHDIPSWNFHLLNGWEVNDFGKNKSGGGGNRCEWTGRVPERGGTYIPKMLKDINPLPGQSGGCAAWVSIVGPDGLEPGVPSYETIHDDLGTCRDVAGYH